MTIAAAWVRRVGNCEEMIFASDSRLSGDGNTFDYCPKIFILPRSDCVISFAGYTGHAYPMMLQLISAIESNIPAKRGALELSALRSHALKIFNSMADQIQASIHVNTDAETDPEATFLFGGYSWTKKRFQLWAIIFDSTAKKFYAHPANWLTYLDEAGSIIYRKRKAERDETNIGHFSFAGDQAPKARAALLEKLNSRPPNSRNDPLDWEPFEVIRDMLRESSKPETIGGAPQVVKIYQYMQAAPVCVYWPNKESGSIHLQGRKCLGYENIDRGVLDPDTLQTEPYKIINSSEISPLDTET
jgi:hypothetical protein